MKCRSNRSRRRSVLHIRAEVVHRRTILLTPPSCSVSTRRRNYGEKRQTMFGIVRKGQSAIGSHMRSKEHVYIVLYDT